MDVPLLVTLSIMICLCTRQSGSIALCYVDLLGALVVTFFSICSQCKKLPRKLNERRNCALRDQCVSILDLAS